MGIFVPENDAFGRGAMGCVSSHFLIILCFYKIPIVFLSGIHIYCTRDDILSSEDITGTHGAERHHAAFCFGFVHSG